MAKQQQPPRRPNQPGQQQPQNPSPAAPRKPAPAPVRAAKTAAPRFNLGSNELIFTRDNLKWMGIGLGLICAAVLSLAMGEPRKLTLLGYILAGIFFLQFFHLWPF